MTGKDASGGEFAESGNVFERAIEHAVENVLVNGGAVGVELAGRADQDLAGFARLNIESDRIFAAAVSAFEITELDDLVTSKSGKAIGDDEVAFAFTNGQAVGESWRGWTGGIDSAMC